MPFELAASPTTWGVDFADGPSNPPWSEVLDDIAAAGLNWLELGPIGYLPEDPGVLGSELRARDLRTTGTFLFRPYWDPTARSEIMNSARRTSALIAALGGDRLVLVDQPSPERAATAGNSDLARRMTREEREPYFDNIASIGRVARDDYGVRAVVHPHAGTYIEFEDEIDEALVALPAELVGLCVDTGHSIFAGLDPAEVIRRYPDRVEHMHLKDIDAEVLARVRAGRLGFWEAIRQRIFVPVGEGVVDVVELDSALNDIGFDRPITLEQDRDPTREGVPIEDLRRSIDYFRQTIEHLPESRTRGDSQNQVVMPGM